MSDSEYERVLNTARIVLSLLKRSETPPEPPAYEAVFGALSPGDTLDDEALRDLVLTRIADDADRKDRAQRLGVELGDGIAAIGDTLETAAASASRFSQSLASAEREVTSAATAPALRAVLARLIEETMRTQRANKQLKRRAADTADQIETVQAQIAETRRDASVDALTRIGNRRHFDNAAPQMVASAASANAPLCLVVFDVDHFRRFNETYGHQMGDEVLRVIARVLTGLTNRTDLIARIGGEEFAALLPGRSLDAANGFCERLREKLGLQTLASSSEDRDMERITASYGVTELRPGDSVLSLMERADRCLYAAKQAGRNRIVANGNSMAEGSERAPLPAQLDDDEQSLLDLLAAIN